MKMMALVLCGIFVGLGLIILPTLGTPSFPFLSPSSQYSSLDGKNNSGTVLAGDNATVPAAEAQGYTVYRSVSESPAGPYGAPGLVLALGVGVAVAAYVIIRKSAP